VKCHTDAASYCRIRCSSAWTGQRAEQIANDRTGPDWTRLDKTGQDWTRLNTKRRRLDKTTLSVSIPNFRKTPLSDDKRLLQNRSHYWKRLDKTGHDKAKTGQDWMRQGQDGTRLQDWT